MAAASPGGRLPPLLKALICLWKGHDFGDWYPWHRDAPRIVFASLEYMNDRREFRDCARCGCQQQRK